MLYHRNSINHRTLTWHSKFPESSYPNSNHSLFRCTPCMKGSSSRQCGAPIGTFPNDKHEWLFTPGWFWSGCGSCRSQGFLWVNSSTHASIAEIHHQWPRGLSRGSWSFSLSLTWSRLDFPKILGRQIIHCDWFYERCERTPSCPVSVIFWMLSAHEQSRSQIIIS